ncbi:MULTISPECIES: ZIP family metal transporter [Catenuloplanes]|uniref:ZIP family zinc transporter n=1 Tax=Catenuloplanes niger TaxID=587534 RepID=A0AAE4CY71_9ACTN|nr:ZIP family zinc transporter [Catenuloplanes niger]MDR7328182.1 ZIP family zinc transporter [Catenuloplanes niger]
MLEAAFWGFVGGFALLVGAVLGLVRPVPDRVVGTVMAFGAGVLISTVSFDLVEEAFTEAGAVPVGVGILAGAVTFFAGDAIVDRRGGDDRKHPAANAGGAAFALVLGAMLDGIPESAAIGVSLLGGGAVSTAVVAGVFLSNVPESLSAAVGLRASGRSVRWILGLWAGVAVVSAVAAALGYALLGGAGPATVAVVQAFAAGAILTMLADTMVPVAVRYSGPLVGIVTCAGFLLAFMLTHA